MGAFPLAPLFALINNVFEIRYVPVMPAGDFFFGGGLLVKGVQNLPPMVGIGLNDLPNNGGRRGGSAQWSTLLLERHF